MKNYADRGGCYPSFSQNVNDELRWAPFRNCVKVAQSEFSLTVLFNFEKLVYQHKLSGCQ